MNCPYCVEGQKNNTVTCEKNHFQDVKVKKAKFFTPIDFECMDFLE